MDESPVVDPAALLRLGEWGGRDLTRKMVDIFLTSTSERVAQIRKGLELREAKMAEAGAHSLKSSAGNVGALRLQELAAQAESLAEDQELDAVHAMIQEIQAAYEEACGELQRLMEEGDA